MTYICCVPKRFGTVKRNDFKRLFTAAQCVHAFLTQLACVVGIEFFDCIHDRRGLFVVFRLNRHNIIALRFKLLKRLNFNKLYIFFRYAVFFHNAGKHIVSAFCRIKGQRFAAVPKYLIFIYLFPFCFWIKVKLVFYIYRVCFLFLLYHKKTSLVNIIIFAFLT